DRMMVGEVWPRDQRSLADYLRADELQQAFNFRFLFCPWSASDFRARIEDVEELFPRDSWPTYTLSNHDFPRHISRYAAGESTDARARLAAMLLLTLRGTPFLYYGEEIGMQQVSIPQGRVRDPMGRDGCRTPMQWSNAAGAGFTAASEPWLPIGDCESINVARQMDDPDSMLSFYRRMIRARKESRAFSAGSYRTVADAPQECLVFIREAEGERVMVALNFADAPRRITTPRGQVIIGTDPRRFGKLSDAIELSPAEGIAIALER
ncbi:MAG TPA: alpha-amylase family glycosyl hydrolase, partial [Candidatus Binataceae bacterium]|nr:alpha-amylase family glycosyl hydrolase [Candidatus Binataceae bacterium]